MARISPRLATKENFSPSSPIAKWMAQADAFIQSPERIVADSIPFVLSGAPSGDGVYFIVHDGLIQYVGRSNNLSARLETHFDRWQFDAYHIIQGMPPMFTGDLEEFYIGWLQPFANTRRWRTEMQTQLRRAQAGAYGDSDPWVLSRRDVVQYCGELGVHLRYECSKTLRILEPA